ncbi:hypothetical protein GCM10017600_10410 [Streptosporangium carneum]|uniref:Uncharacterized protein n=1 Tax=Streptosporangium carneum TaxID=47481 RepID=A0A9W6HWJ4_9ACTN|nr:hypothetical protein GCM10017600_10410 [Streptosporangium carneum]
MSGSTGGAGRQVMAQAPDAGHGGVGGRTRTWGAVGLCGGPPRDGGPPDGGPGGERLR